MESSALKGRADALDSLWNDESRLDRLAREAVQAALQEHKRKGESVVVWRDGRVVTLTPDEILLGPIAEDAA